jgi:disulfide oxidoreductase YuzD
MPTIELFCDGKKLYNIKKLIELTEKLPVSKIKLNELEHQLYLNTWIAHNQRIRPIDVLEYKKNKSNRKLQKNYERIQNVDLKYPILLNEDLLVVDGLHRLAKAKREGKILVTVKVIPNNILSKAEIDIDIKKLKLC